MMRLVMVFGVGFASYASICAEEKTTSKKYAGVLERELVPEFARLASITLTKASKADISFPTPPDAKLFSGELRLPDAVRAQEILRAQFGMETIPVLLVESMSQGAYLYPKLGRDASFSEGIKFQPESRRPKAIGDAVLQIPLVSGAFPFFPIRFRLFPPDNQAGGPPGERTLFCSHWAFATGVVDVEGAPLRVWAQYSWPAKTADPRNGTNGMDLDGDGDLAVPPSPERAFAKNEELIFRMGERFLSINKINPEDHTIVLVSHPESEYGRIELSPGVVFPNFEFTDFGGAKRKLSEFDGKFVLLDFWGSWCGPCIAEFPYLKGAYEKWHGRGLEIIGIDSEESLAQATKCVAEHDLPWIQATSDSTRELVQKRLGITVYPTLVLLDPARRIISVGRDLLGDDLHKSLERLLPTRR